MCTRIWWPIQADGISDRDNNRYRWVGTGLLCGDGWAWAL